MAFVKATKSDLIKDIKHLIKFSVSNYDNTQVAASMLLDLFSTFDDDERESINNIVPADYIENLRKQQLKDQLNTDNDYEPCTLQDLAFIDRNDDEKYFYINGGNRVCLVTITDIDAELSDLLSDIQDEKKSK